MSDLYNGVELWLVSERQHMAQPDTLTTYLGKKDPMLDGIRFDPSDNRNTGAAKARSHIDNCAWLLNTLATYEFKVAERCKQLGELASKSFKVASGYSMRAGYFYPNEPPELYADRTVKLVNADGSNRPVLGKSIEELERYAIDTLSISDSSPTIEAAHFLLTAGRLAADDADHQLKDLVQEELARDAAFSGSDEAQRKAEGITIATMGSFVDLGLTALRLQGEGPDGFGPLIPEPRSSAEANFYLRIMELTATVINGVTQVSSPNMVLRNINN